MPLHEPMRANLKSQIADLVNAAEGQGGAITAALYLSEFITPPKKNTVKKEETDMGSSDSSTGTLPDGTPTSTSTEKLQETSVGGDDIPTDQSQDTNDLDNNDNGKRSKMTWIHVDFPGAPLGLRAVYQFIKTLKR